MEREIQELKRQLARQSSSGQIASNIHNGGNGYMGTVPIDQWSGSHEAVASLLDLRSGIDSSTGYARSPNTQSSTSKRLEDIVITNDRAIELFNR